MTAAKANEIAAKIGTPQAEAMKNMLLSQYGTQQAQLHQGLAVANIAHRAYTEGIPDQAVPLLPKEQQERMVRLPNGQMADAGSSKSAEIVKETMAPIQEARQAIERIDQIKSVYAVLPGPERLKAKAEAANMANLLQSMSQQKRFSDSAIEYQAQKFSDPSNIEDLLVGHASSDQFKKILQGKEDSIYRVHVPAYSQQKTKQEAIPFKKN